MMKGILRPLQRGAIGVAEELCKTWQVLAGTQNRAVLALLRAGLRSCCAEVRADAIRCGIRRHDMESHRLLIGRFPKLSWEERKLLCQMHAAAPSHMARALRWAALDGDAAFCASACEIIKQGRDFNLFSVLVRAAEQGTHHAAAAVQSMRHLADVLHSELAAWADSDQQGRDPTFDRRNALVALERSLSQYERHLCKTILETFLLLAPGDNTMLLRILHDPQHACHGAMVAALSASPALGALQCLAQLARDTAAPPAALVAMANRTDRPFVQHLLQAIKRPVPLRVLHNIKRLRRIAWLEEHREILLELNANAQAVAAELAMASGIVDESKFQLFQLLLQEGLAEARRVSCQALSKFDRAEATALILAALEDPDDAVRAAAIRQLRSRDVPDALTLLIGFLDSSSMEVRDAARSALAEFNFMRYRSMFDVLDATTAKTTGPLVYKVDSSASQGLIDELTSPSVSTRRRGIEMAVAMNAADDVCDELISLANQDNLVVRREALAALGKCQRADIENVLYQAAEDPHETIRETARWALAQRGAATERHAGERAAVLRGVP